MDEEEADEVDGVGRKEMMSPGEVRTGWPSSCRGFSGDRGGSPAAGSSWSQQPCRNMS